MKFNLQQLAIEGHGAVQVDESPDIVPPIVVLIGPIKIWWNEWDSPRHQLYVAWRDAVRVALVKAGCAVYSPHRAIQGRWNERLQRINDAAIQSADWIVNLTPKGVPATGTDCEVILAQRYRIPIVNAPPGGPAHLEELLHTLDLNHQS